MAVLEQEGYLAQPHTSAGRVPTDKGYRFFVDHMGSPGRLEPVAQQRVGQFFDSTHGRLEELLHQTTNLLAQVTHHAAVVVGPRAETATVRAASCGGGAGLAQHAWRRRAGKNTRDAGGRSRRPMRICCGRR